MDGFARKLMNNIYSSFSNFTIFLRANSLATVQIGNSVPNPSDYYAASIVKKGKGGSLNKQERKKKGNNIRSKEDTCMCIMGYAY